MEIEPVPPDDARIVWEWHLWDHLVQDVDPEKPGYGSIADHPELMDINFGNLGGAFEAIDVILISEIRGKTILRCIMLDRFFS